MNYNPYNIQPPNQYQYNSGVVPNGTTPPNIGSIGGAGYNSNFGSYYTNNYNYNPYNPFYLRQQQELYEAQQREARNNQINIMKRLNKCASDCLGIEHNDTNIDIIYGNYEQRPEEYQFIQEIQNYNQFLTRYKPRDPDYKSKSPRYLELMRRTAKCSDEFHSKVKEDASLCEFLDVGGELYIDALMNDPKNNQKDLTRLYNRGDYLQLLNMHNNSRFNAFNRDVTIDDMSIELPPSLKSNYSARRQQFLEAIMNKI